MPISLGSLIARINAINLSTAAIQAKNDGAGGLKAVIFMADGAKVMLKSKL